jgi:hypothetical protein
MQFFLLHQGGRFWVLALSRSLGLLRLGSFLFSASASNLMSWLGSARKFRAGETCNGQLVGHGANSA